MSETRIWFRTDYVSVGGQVHLVGQFICEPSLQISTSFFISQKIGMEVIESIQIVMEQRFAPDQQISRREYDAAVAQMRSSELPEINSSAVTPKIMFTWYLLEMECFPPELVDGLIAQAERAAYENAVDETFVFSQLFSQALAGGLESGGDHSKEFIGCSATLH